MVIQLPKPTSITTILLTLLAFSSAYVCFPPPGPLPLYRDCLALVNGIEWLSRQPYENLAKQWGRHLATSAHTEKLPRWYYIEERQPSTTCMVLVDVEGAAFYSVGTFPLRNVAVAADVAYHDCLIGKQQIGLEFPSEESHIYAKVMRLEGRPHLKKFGVASEERWRRVVLPDRSVLVVADGPWTQGVTDKNVSASQ
ncbi:MAG: hypothetical protein L6R36_009026 [Xanthoria steineri]|nr:MAG: hypothetical protein L6R36_009026 [Xanthoria steineri]